MNDGDHERLRLLATEVAPIFVAAIDRVLADRYAKEQEEIALLRRARAEAEENAGESRLALCNERERTRTPLDDLDRACMAARRRHIALIFSEIARAEAVRRRADEESTAWIKGADYGAAFARAEMTKKVGRGREDGSG